MTQRKRDSVRGAFWLAGQFDRRPHPSFDQALGAWSEVLGRAQAELWMEARTSEGRGR